MCQSAWALAHSLIGKLLALCRTEMSRCTCSDLVPLERTGPVPALGDGDVSVASAASPVKPVLHMSVATGAEIPRAFGSTACEMGSVKQRAVAHR